jgi:uncharacterized protein
MGSWQLIAIFGLLVQDAIDMNVLRLLYLGFGWLCVGLGVIGIVMPILPTTPFLLVAVWAFSKSSPELAAKLRNHPQLGLFIRSWQDHGAIPPVGKIMSIAMMTASGAYFIYAAILPFAATVALCAAFALIAIYILTRPSSGPKP